MPCSWIGRINVCRMPLLSKFNQRIHVSAINSLTSIFVEFKILILNFLWKWKILRMAWTLKKKKKSRGSCSSDLNIHYRVLLIKRCDISRGIDRAIQQIEIAEIISYTRKTPIEQNKQDRSVNKRADHFTGKNMYIYFKVYSKINSGWAKDHI